MSEKCFDIDENTHELILDDIQTQEHESKHNNLPLYIVSLLTGFTYITLLTLNTCSVKPHRSVPNTFSVEEEIVIPSKLEESIDKLDGILENETILTSEGKSYSLKQYKDGKVHVHEIEIRPVDSVQKSE